MGNAEAIENNSVARKLTYGNSVAIPTAGAFRALPDMCGALGRASVNSGAANGRVSELGSKREWRRQNVTGSCAL
jgi:hypothetical protein